MSGTDGIPIILWQGLETNRSGVTPEAGELLYVTDEKAVYVGDGSTSGGLLIGRAVSNDRGTSFPGSPVDGDLFFRTDHGVLYYWFDSSIWWESVEQQVFTAGKAGTAATGIYLEQPGAMASGRGYQIPWGAVISAVSMSWATSATGALRIRRNGVTKTSLSLGGGTDASVEALHTDFDGADSTLEFFLDSLSVSISDPIATVWLRRKET